MDALGESAILRVRGTDLFGVLIVLCLFISTALETLC